MEELFTKVVTVATALTKLIVKILEIFDAKPDTGISFGEDEIKDLATEAKPIIDLFK